VQYKERDIDEEIKKKKQPIDKGKEKPVHSQPKTIIKSNTSRNTPDELDVLLK
jgi:hypothetical protein